VPPPRLPRDSRRPAQADGSYAGLRQGSPLDQRGTHHTHMRLPGIWPSSCPRSVHRASPTLCCVGCPCHQQRGRWRGWLPRGQDRTGQDRTGAQRQPFAQTTEGQPPSDQHATATGLRRGRGRGLLPSFFVAPAPAGAARLCSAAAAVAGWCVWWLEGLTCVRTLADCSSPVGLWLLAVSSPPFHVAFCALPSLFLLPGVRPSSPGGAGPWNAFHSRRSFVSAAATGTPSWRCHR
jgi:hypothetical protein